MKEEKRKKSSFIEKAWSCVVQISATLLLLIIIVAILDRIFCTNFVAFFYTVMCTKIFSIYLIIAISVVISKVFIELKNKLKVMTAKELIMELIEKTSLGLALFFIIFSIFGIILFVITRFESGITYENDWQSCKLAWIGAGVCFMLFLLVELIIKLISKPKK